MENQAIINSGMGIVILGLLIAAGISLDSDNIYYGTDGQEVTCQPRVCDKLSKVNSDGKQTRCYFFDEIENRTRYKNCQDGWIKFENIKADTLNVNGTICYVFQQNDLIKECRTEQGEHVLYILGD